MLPADPDSTPSLFRVSDSRSDNPEDDFVRMFIFQTVMGGEAVGGIDACGGGGEVGKREGCVTTVTSCEGLGEGENQNLLVNVADFHGLRV